MAQVFMNRALSETRKQIQKLRDQTLAPLFDSFSQHRDALVSSLAPLLAKTAEQVEALHWNLRPMREMAVDDHDLLLHTAWKRSLDEAVNPLNKLGAKYFSQTDEDGLTLEILRRLGVDRGVYGEIGVGNGTENNSLILAAKGWSGFWVGGEPLVFTPQESWKNFAFLHRWVDLDNVVALVEEGLGRLKQPALDVLSLDLDGNDLYLAERLLGRFSPKLFIVEYNAKFPPPIRWQIDYDPKHRWAGDDYFGASLESFRLLFEKHGYFLACCNAHTGANAFFVKEEHRSAFADVPRDAAQLFYPPRYFLYRGFGHKPSPKTLERIFRQNE
jgi:hypothetical protein